MEKRAWKSPVGNKISIFYGKMSVDERYLPGDDDGRDE
jgi:hypothetical protein